MESTRSPRRVSVESTKHCFMESSWNPLYFRQSLWTPHGVFIDSSWTPHGVHGDYWELVGNAVWSPHGLYMESPWSLHGVLMESMETLCGLHRVFMDSMETRG